ncbi:UPF0236 family transposase-like protein [Spiroplasma ixodetis]|uniref:UPF0236 family transposase-like protein n=1 Tax=Spiroplasma ixodetis TaxID=2141 RepID=UPI00330775A2
MDKLVLEHLKKKWEKWNWRIKNTRDKKKYKIVDYQYRTRKTLYGIVTYKRRIYEYFDEELQKWIRICLVDEILQLPKNKRIGEDIEDNIIENFADGKRYRDICAICKKAGISISTVHRVFKNLQVFEANPVKVKLENGLLPTCTCGGNNEIEWVQQCFSNRTGLFKIYSKFEEKQMYHVFLNKFEYF